MRNGADALSVALHPEGVDRNFLLQGSTETATDVALHPEGVDRNLVGLDDIGKPLAGRPPPGGRG